jgi:hypothetical protein
MESRNCCADGGQATLRIEDNEIVEHRVSKSRGICAKARAYLVTLLCEERIGLAVKHPIGFTKGTFTAAITDLTS